MRKLTVEENKEYQLKILNSVHDYCIQNGIRYFLIAGSLLGAVRHKGYIPWDDDIDLAMLREDYERFVREFFIPGYYIVAPEIHTEGYYLPYAKICMKDTYVCENTKKTTVKMGINIDLFPIDIVPENKKKRRRELRKIQLNRKILDIIDTPLSKRRSLGRNIALAILQTVLFPVSARKIIDNIVYLSKKNNRENSMLCGEIVWGCGEREIVNRSVFDGVQYLDFEGKEYSVPVGWDEWLNNRYGDYMKLPPFEQQVSHHDCNAYILEKGETKWNKRK